MKPDPDIRPDIRIVIAAFFSGGLLALMLLFNGGVAREAGALFASWTAHAVGGVFAAGLLLTMRTKIPIVSNVAPKWSYLGGVSGALIVMLSASAVNSPLGLAGTIAIGLAGQMVFSLAADAFGLFGMVKKRPARRDYAALACVLVGSLLIVL